MLRGWQPAMLLHQQPVQLGWHQGPASSGKPDAWLCQAYGAQIPPRATSTSSLYSPLCASGTHTSRLCLAMSGGLPEALQALLLQLQRQLCRSALIAKIKRKKEKKEALFAAAQLLDLFAFPFRLHQAVNEEAKASHKLQPCRLGKSLEHI